MSRRVSLPGAEELFGNRPEDKPGSVLEEPPRDNPGDRFAEKRGPAARRPGSSGRVRHDEKITVYVTGDELLALEHTRLALRSNHGLAVDRGRFVREAIHLAIERVQADGDESSLVQRLRGS